MYADLDVWLAALAADSSCDGTGGESVEDLLDRHAGELEVSLVTFLELFLVEEEYPFDRERAISAILELAEYDGDADVLFRASANRERGMDTFEAFHEAMATDGRLSIAGAET